MGEYEEVSIKLGEVSRKLSDREHEIVYLLELLRRLLAALEGKASISHKEYVELKQQVREELGDAVGGEG